MEALSTTGYHKDNIRTTEFRSYRGEGHPDFAELHLFEAIQDEDGFLNQTGAIEIRLHRDKRDLILLDQLRHAVEEAITWARALPNQE